MTDSLPITCPNCGEEFHVPFDPSEGSAEFVTDCENCCRPISITVHVRDGEVDDLRISAG